MAIAEPLARPTGSYDEALRRITRMQALDDGQIDPYSRTAFFNSGARTKLAVVLLHGFTNSPAQFAAFAPLLAQQGVNVLVPRLPEHGDVDRMTLRLLDLRAEALVATTYEAIDIACGLGEQVTVLGVSSGGMLAMYAAQRRADIAIAVPVVPVFGILDLPFDVTRALMRLAEHAPNIFLWWDPRVKLAHRPRSAYPRFPSRALAQTMRLADDVYRHASLRAPAAARIVTITSANDPAVNNQETAQVMRAWREFKPDGIELIVLRNLPVNHDIVDPDNPDARLDIVYPVLLHALGLE